MPTYEYKCDACGHEFEKFQSITAPAIKTCPKCRKHKVRRLISTGAGLIFKGSGFYITDYRSDSYKEKAKTESGDGAKKTDSKPDAPAKPASGSTEAPSTPAPARKETKPSSKNTKKE